MEDLFAAGGVDAVLRELAPLLDLSCMTVTGETLGERLARPPADPVDRAIVGAENRWSRRAGSSPCSASSRRAAPSSSARPPTSASSSTPAARSSSPRSTIFRRRIDSDDLDVTADDILVLQNAGPRSDAAMPEAGYLPIPQEARPRRRQGHDPYVRCSHVGHGLWRRGSPRDAGRRQRRSARPRSDGDLIRLSVAERRSTSGRPPNSTVAGRLAAGPAGRGAAMTASTMTTCCLPTRAATSISASSDFGDVEPAALAGPSERRRRPPAGSPRLPGSRA